ncbi:type IX secretion system membrane protein PorP/SprF [Draconibacterium sp. IB214405]|uniref:PorP/SprF family type IX secretion system membrane protein n=1 Tax=Draconibacterium sp. IB214405 TaxID=3097352 RepID=UPI002A116701|nr:type IX secretion system membrane protein PorP/SprF [Draconibacterium sp. IB214405]MDX8339233.1 type IX secretion system membrane protein PorP/SprF [Draconibacterium sp. IB214405]
MNFKILLGLLFMLPCAVYAQDPGYSQFFANPLHLNPAFAGTTELSRLVVNYRNQWPQQGNSFTTYSLSYDFLLKKRNAGIGFQAYHDREPNNIITTSSATFSYSYHLKLGMESFMTLGLNAGFVVKQFDPSGLIFPSEIDQLSGIISGTGTYIVDETSRSYPDFAIGAVGQHRNVFWGASVHHLTTPDESIYKGDNKGEIPMKVTIHAGTRLHKFHHDLLSRRFTLSPNILYQQQGSFKQLNMGIYMIEKSFLFGGWFRNNIDTRPDAIIALIGFAREKFQFGYSFDYTLSELSNYSHGSHEFSLTFFVGAKSEVPIRNKLLIPML